MTISRLAVLVAFVTLGFATVFLLPRSSALPTGIRMELPDFVGNWKGTEAEISEKERTGLGEQTGTRIIRKTYRNLEGYEIMVSIVLSVMREVHRSHASLAQLANESIPVRKRLLQRMHVRHVQGRCDSAQVITNIGPR